MSRVLPALLLVITQLSWAACDDSLPGTGSRDDVLIIVNDNAVDSCEVGRYYAQERGLGRSNILHVKTPANPTIDYVQYEILRNQIIRELQQRIGGTAASCATPGDTLCTEVTDQLRTGSAIKYLVLTKGVPARVIRFGSETWVTESANEAGSVDGYLRNQLGKIFYPARIDGLDLAAAKRLVDRAIAAEVTGWRGELQSVASKTDGAWGSPADSRFSKSNYALDPAVPVHSEKLALGYPAVGDYPGDPDGLFAATGSFYWRYQFGLFGEVDEDCTGNTTAGSWTDFYLNNAANLTAGKAPAKCRVKLSKGNGANPAASELAPGFSNGRAPRAVDTVAFLGHLDNQPTFIGYFDVAKSWTRNDSCTARLCKDDPTDPAACRAASTDTYKEFDTRCIGVADGFIGHNFQSWPLSYFTGWPTAWRPLGIPSSDTSSNPLGSEIGGSDHAFVAYPQVREDDGDGDSTSLWYGAHDKLETTTCYASDLTTTVPCRDLNTFQIGQKVVDGPTGTVDSVQYYRVSVSYRSVAGETGATATAKLAAALVVDDTGAPARLLKPLRAKLNDTLRFAPLRNSGGDVIVGVDSGAWQRASAVLKLDPAILGGTSTKQIAGMALNIYTTGSFSGAVGIDAITLEKVDASEVVEDTLTVLNGDFDEGHNQFAVGDWAATFTSRLNGTAFWGSTTHNCGGTAVFRHLGDTLAHFVGGDELAKAVWKDEGCSGGLLYGDPLYSPVAVKLNALPKRVVFDSGLALTGNVFNGSGSGIDTRYSVHYCYGSDFFTCDRTGGWVATNIVEGPAQPQGRNIALGTLDTTAIDLQRPFLLRLTVTSTKGGKDTVYRDFSQPLQGFDGAANSDSDSLTDGDEIALGTDPLSGDTDGDQLPDDWEVANNFDPLVHDLGEDSDDDGLASGLELFHGTSDSNIDSDGDGYIDFIEVQAGAGFASNPALQPPFGVAPLPMYAGIGHVYRVVLQKQNGATTIEEDPAHPLPDNATLTGDVFEWTPTWDHSGWTDIYFGPAGAPSRHRVYVVHLDGDVNEDGTLDMGDVLKLEQIVLGQVQPTPRQLYRSDIYPVSEDQAPDSQLDLSDLFVMKKLLMP